MSAIQPLPDTDDAVPAQLGAAHGLRYGALGLPLAFVALPLYVLLPAHYAAQFGVPLAALGVVLLGVRVLDALADPLIGRGVDHLFARSPRTAVWVAGAAAVGLALGFRGLFFPPVQDPSDLLWWCAAALAWSYLGYSVISVIHQAWGARLGGDAGERAAVVGWREACALIGVLLASVLPGVAGLQATTLLFALLLAGGVWALWSAPPPRAHAPQSGAVSVLLPWRALAFRRLMLVFVLNGIASAVPATLVLFFVRDRLLASTWEPIFLATYFASAALATPGWVRLVKAHGLLRCWAAGMVLAIASFVWAASLGPDDTWGFLAVCAASGVALGADLTLPGALLTGVIQRAGHGGRAEGAYFGWWNFASKLNLALAAGLTLPALALFGYAPGVRDPQALTALTVAYCLLPCALKLLALAALACFVPHGRLDGGDP